MKAACQRQLDDLARQGTKEFPYRFDEESANRVCRFIELLPHVKGNWGSPTIQLQPWQCFPVTTFFGWLDGEGMRRFRTAYEELPRKNAKTTKASGLGLYLLCADGENGAEVYSAATTRDQAKISWEIAKKMADRTPGLRNRFGVATHAHAIAVEGSASSFKALSADANSLDGLNVHGGILDEVHAHKTRAVFDVINSATGSRKQPVIWMITTAGFNRSGVCYEQRTYATKVLDRVHVDETYFAIIYTIDSEPYVAEFRDIAALGEIGKICNCGCVDHTLIEKSWRETCAAFATTATGAAAKKKASAETIRKGPSGREDCAGPVTSSFCSTKTQNGRPGQSGNGQNGHRATRNECAPPIENGDQGLAARLSSTGSAHPNTALLEKSSTVYLSDNKDSAQYASPERTYAWITATSLESFGEYSAENVTRRLAFSGILRSVYDAHSPTCRAREAMLDGNAIRIKRESDDWTSEAAWRKANPNYGVSVLPRDIATQCRQAMLSAASQNNFLTKRLNVWVNADTSWMNMQSWDACRDETLDLSDFEGQPCYVGTDLATKVDIAAKIRLFPPHGEREEWAIFGNYYLPEAAVEAGVNTNAAHYAGWANEGLMTLTPGEVTDFDVIQDDTLEDFRRFDVREVGLDPFQAITLTNSLERAGADMDKFVEVGATVKNFSPAMKEFEALVLAKKIRHNDPVLTWMISNVVCHTDAKDNIYPRKERPENKIDGAVAAFMALSRAMLARNEGSPLCLSKGMLAL